MVIKKYNIAGVAVGVILGALIVGLIAVFVINTDNDNNHNAQIAQQGTDTNYDYCFLVEQGNRQRPFDSIEGISTFPTRQEALETLTLFEDAREPGLYQWGGCVQYGEINEVIERNKFTYCDILLSGESYVGGARLGGQVFSTRQEAEDYLVSPDRNSVLDSYATHTIWCNR